MFERHEKWIILGLIALAIWYFYKKGKPASSGASVFANPFTGMIDQTMIPADGSLVNPTTEPGYVQPAQSSTPVIYRPAQPSTVGVSQLVSAGQFSYYPAPPVLRTSVAQRYLA